MKILLINYEYPPIGAGAATATYQIAKYLTKQNHNVCVLTSNFGKLKFWKIEDKIKIFRCPTFRKFARQSNIFEMLSFITSSFLFLPALLCIQKIHGSIIFFSLPCGPLGLFGKYILNIPYIISQRGGDVPGSETSLNQFHTWFKPLRRLILKESIAIVANSKGLKKLSEKADPYSVKIIPNGVDTDFFIPAKNKDKKKRLLFVGRFQNQKNIFFLLENLDKVAQQTNEIFEFHLVGEGPLGDSLKNYATKLGIHDRLFWHGWCDKKELRTHYQKAICILNTSFNEGMPNVILEAMACGIPTIASHVAGNDSVVKHSETGFLFDLKHPEQFQKAVHKILNDNKSARKMGLKAREWVKKDFSWDNVAQGYSKLLEDRCGSID